MAEASVSETDQCGFDPHSRHVPTQPWLSVPHRASVALGGMSVTVTCWAGRQIGDERERPLGCRCGVEGTRIMEPSGTPTLARWCFGDYTACPTWIAEKDAIREGFTGAVQASDVKIKQEVTETQRQVALGQKRRMEAFEAGEDDVANMTIPEMIQWNRNQGA